MVPEEENKSAGQKRQREHGQKGECENSMQRSGDTFMMNSYNVKTCSGVQL